MVSRIISKLPAFFPPMHEHAALSHTIDLIVNGELLRPSFFLLNHQT